MYRLVYESECKEYRNACSQILKKTCNLLREKDIVAQFVLVGSGAKNMVTRNGDGPFDLDYNLVIIKAPDMYWNGLCRLKDTVRNMLDRAAKNFRFAESQDSTSCLTAHLYFEDEPTVEFSFDIAIVKRNPKGELCRLIHEKIAFGPDRYFWNEVPNSNNVAEKAARLKEDDLWPEVRKKYVDLKNRYLIRQRNKDHPSFIVYIEAVNEIYNKTYRRAF